MSVSLGADPVVFFRGCGFCLMEEAGRGNMFEQRTLLRDCAGVVQTGRREAKLAFVRPSFRSDCPALPISVAFSPVNHARKAAIDCCNSAGESERSQLLPRMRKRYSKGISEVGLMRGRWDEGTECVGFRETTNRTTDLGQRGSKNLCRRRHFARCGIRLGVVGLGSPDPSSPAALPRWLSVPVPFEQRKGFHDTG